MWTNQQIISLIERVREVVDLVLLKRGFATHRMFLIGSYASGTQTVHSDIDFLVELKGGTWDRGYPTYPTWQEIQSVQAQLPKDVHVIFGREVAQQRKGLPYKRLYLKGEDHVPNSCSTSH